MLVSPKLLSTHILILISDDQIIDFLDKHQNHLKDKICIHFSGCIYTKLAFGAHPLNTFSDNLYDINKYENETRQAGSHKSLQSMDQDSNIVHACGF